MHVNLSWLKVDERLASSLLVFVRSIDTLNAPSCLFKLLEHSSDTNAYPTRHATRIPKCRTDYWRRTVLYRAMATWNSIPHQVTDASSRIRFTKQIFLNTPYGTEGTVKRQTHEYKHMIRHEIYTHSTHTYMWMLYCKYVIVEQRPEGTQYMYCVKCYEMSHNILNGI